MLNKFSARAYHQRLTNCIKRYKIDIIIVVGSDEKIEELQEVVKK
jgi:hypothetical protein